MLVRRAPAMGVAVDFSDTVSARTAAGRDDLHEAATGTQRSEVTLAAAGFGAPHPPASRPAFQAAATVFTAQETRKVTVTQSLKEA